jgi:uracil-DNA glycosylase family 4
MPRFAVPRGQPLQRNCDVTRRRSSYRSLASLQRDNRTCRACLEAGYPLESLPVVEGAAGQRAYIFGQAPGILEGQELRPWRGRAGRTLRRWLDLDEPAFYATFYCASVTRCYPGKSPNGKGDRVPTPEEQELCEFWRDWELRLLQPRLVVPVGTLAIGRLLGKRPLANTVGVHFQLAEDRVAIPLPHPSGVSLWLNSPTNRALVEQAVELIHAELAAIGARPKSSADSRS